MRRRAKVDRNHGEVVTALRDMGWWVHSTAQLGDGFPDLMIAKAGRLLLIEVKDGTLAPSKRKLSPDEEDLHAALKQHGVEVLLVQRLSDLAQLDRQAREKVEGLPPRDYYGE